LLGKGSYGQVYFKKYIYIVVIGCKMSIWWYSWVFCFEGYSLIILYIFF
jgi:hypothetical protein